MSPWVRAQKISIYLSEGRGAGHSADAAYAILEYLFHADVSGATVLKGIAGFGREHRLHASSIVEIADHLPVKVEFIETPEKVEALLPRLSELCGSGLIELQETTIFRPSDGASTAPAQPFRP